MSASPIGPRAWHIVLALLFGLVLFAAVATGATGVSGTSGTSGATPTMESTDESSAPIDVTLEDADGTVTVLVRLESFDAGADASERRSDVVATRQAHAEASQQPLERYANATDGVTVERGFWVTNAALVTVDTDRAALAELAAIAGVVELRADERVTLSSVDTETQAATTPWTASRSSEPRATNAVRAVRAPEAWHDFHTRGADVTVAVLDTGVDAAHPDLEVEGWRDFSSTPSDEPIDYDGHGTRVSGVVAGGNTSGTQIGVAPEATLLHGAVATECEEQCRTRPSTVLAGLEWAIAEGADVISLSLGWPTTGSESIELLETAEEAGVVVVAGVGNDGAGSSLAPANTYDVIGVGAVDRRDNVPSFSGGEEIDTATRWGANAPAHWPDSYVVPDVVAPGVAVETTDVGGEYTYRSGTSFATPAVTGTVALVQSATEDDLEPAEIKRVLEETAWKPDGEPGGTDVRYGSGIIDADAAIDAAGEHATLEGTVTDTETGAPISDATVEVVGDGAVYERTTDDDGRFELTGLAGDREYTVLVERDGYESTTETATLSADETTAIDVALAGAGRLEVEVTDEHFGDGLETATVEASGSRGTYAAGYVGNGTYRLENVPTDRDYDLRASAPGYVDVERTIAVAAAMSDGGPEVESIPLSGDATLAVTVETTDGEPIENATVAIERASNGVAFDARSTTDDDGRLEVAVPGTGESYTVTAAAPDSAFEPGTVETEPVESGETTAVTVRLSAPLSVPGFGVGAAAVAFAIAMLALGAAPRGRRVES